MDKAVKCVCYTRPRIRKVKAHTGPVGWYVECSCGRRTDDAYFTKGEAVAEWNRKVAKEKGA